jgi:hypothetical protein
VTAPEPRPTPPCRPQPRRTPRRRLTGLIVLLLLATAVVMIWRWPWAWVPAVLAGIVFVVAARLVHLDQRIAAESPVAGPGPARRERRMRRAEWAVGTRATLLIVGGLAACALLVAAVALQWTAVGIGALLVFAWMVLLGLPVWLAAVEDDVADEHRQIAGSGPHSAGGGSP